MWIISGVTRSEFGLATAPKANLHLVVAKLKEWRQWTLGPNSQQSRTISIAVKKNANPFMLALKAGFSAFIVVLALMNMAGPVMFLKSLRQLASRAMRAIL